MKICSINISISNPYGITTNVRCYIFVLVLPVRSFDKNLVAKMFFQISKSSVVSLSNMKDLSSALLHLHATFEFLQDVLKRLQLFFYNGVPPVSSTT